jgi:hypothetical protein
MKFIGIILWCSVSFALAPAQAPIPVPGWPHKTQDSVFANTAVPQFGRPDNGGVSSVYYNTVVTSEVIRFNLNGSFHEGWPRFLINNLFNHPLTVCDMDRDGEDEVIAIGSLRSLFLLDGDGSIIQGFPVTIEGIAPPNVADFDNDDEYEMIFFSYQTDLVYCINAAGEMETGWPIPRPQYGDGSIGGGGAVGDLDHDGYLEYLLKGRQFIYCFRYDGTVQPGFPIHIFDEDWRFQPWFGPSLADIDEDGDLEILVTGIDNNIAHPSGFVAVYENTGEMRPGWPRILAQKFPLEAPTAGDINGDGILELGFAATELIYFMDADAVDISPWPLAFNDPNGGRAAANSDLILVDIDGDNDCEIFWDNNVVYYDSIGQDSILYGGYGFMFGVDHYGQPLPGFPLQVEGEMFWRAPTFAYDENSHHMYLGIHSEANFLPWDPIDTGYVELFVFPDSTGPPDQWPMQSHDNLHTKNYNFVDNVTALHSGVEILPTNYVLKQNYPNPFNASTTIEFALPEAGEVSLIIYDILGREMMRPVSGYREAGSYSINVAMDEAGSGVYFYILRTEKTSISRSMVMIK